MIYIHIRTCVHERERKREKEREREREDRERAYACMCVCMYVCMHICIYIIQREKMQLDYYKKRNHVKWIINDVYMYAYIYT